MTAHQQKCLLSFLGYEGEQATAEFQAHYGLVSDGIFGPKTREKILQVICQPDGWSGIRHFTRGEFACKCGGICDGFPAEPEEKLVRIADGIREHFAAPAIVTSGVRCSMHNANVGGVSNSRHLTGKAMDFSVRGKTAAQVLDYVKKQPEIRYAYAIDGRDVHMDIE